MRKYAKEYLSTHDIDWFCFINNKPIHAASNGGKIPEIINNVDANIENQIKAYSCKYIYSENDIEINRDYIDNKIKETIRDCSDFTLTKMRYNYQRTFVDMARRGFYSFDREDDPRSKKYHLIAWPKNYNTIPHVNFTDLSFSKDDLDLNNPNPSKSVVFNKLREYEE